VHEALLIRRKPIAALADLDQGTRPRQCIIDRSVRLEFGERVDPALQLVAQHGGHIGTLQEVGQDCDRPREVVPHPNDEPEIIFEDPHAPHVCRWGIWGAQERFTRVDSRVKLPGCDLQLDLLGDGEAREVRRCEEVLP
jgi:hypothetical protein